MNRKQFLTLIVVGLVVGALGIYFYNHRKESFTASSFQKGQTVIKDFPLNDVAHIRIKEADGEVNLVRADIWTVKERWDYPANFSEISGFLRKMWELKPVQDIEVGASQYGRLELLNPNENSANAGALVEFKDDKAATLKSVIFGKQHMKESAAGPFGGGGSFPVGRYILVPENPAKVWLVNETFSNIDTKPEQWLNKDFFKVEKIKSVSVSYPENQENSWTVLRETENGEWKLAEPKAGENFDPSKASSLNWALSSPSFNDVASPELTPEETGLAQPVVAKLETFEGFLYTLNVGNTNEDNIYLQVHVAANIPKQRTPAADEKDEDKERLDKEFSEKNEKLIEKLKNEEKFKKWTYLVSKWTVDSVLKQRNDFMSEKQDEPEETTDLSSDEDHSDHDHPPIETVPSILKELPPLPEREPESEEE